MASQKRSGMKCREHEVSRNVVKLCQSTAHKRLKRKSTIVPASTKGPMFLRHFNFVQLLGASIDCEDSMQRFCLFWKQQEKL